MNAMSDDKLNAIAGEPMGQVRKSVTIDWQYREGARAKLRVLVKRILIEYGYPPHGLSVSGVRLLTCAAG